MFNTFKVRLLSAEIKTGACLRYKVQKIIMFRQLLYIGCLVFLLCIQFIGFTGCVKEYSYEGGPAQDTAHDSIPLDTVFNQPIVFPVCLECKDSDALLPSIWDFKYDTSFLCGNITRAIIAHDRSGFTFFGPSVCSSDTGLVMTVYLGSDLLDRDKSNIITSQVIFEYYDNVTLTDIFSTQQLGSFYLTLESYEYATGLAKGSFNGYVPAKNGEVVQIKNGKFQVKFE